MSGTSVDGIDGVLVQLSELPCLSQVQAAFHHYQPFTAGQRAAILELLEGRDAGAEAVCRMNATIGEWLAEAALATMRAAGVAPSGVDIIGSHGQTVSHLPAPAGQVGATLQIGEPAVIAERTGITTVADFRVRDVAAGGQGAPLVSFVDVLLFRQPGQSRAVLNLGGIANLTVLPPLESDLPPLAFDTGPGNMVLDWLAGRASGGALACDLDGRLAAAGTVQESLLAELIEGDAYVAAPAPKTTGRERYGAAFARGLWERATARGVAVPDLMATATALTAQTVAMGLRQAGFGGRDGAGVTEVIAGGGGTRNPTLMAELGRRLEGATLRTHADYGIDSQAKEALGFAVLGAAAVRGRVNTVPSCTGARRPVVMGKLVPGENFVPLMARLFGSGGVPRGRERAPGA